VASRQRKASHQADRPTPDQPAVQAIPAWRQPPPETRANIRRHQMSVRRTVVAPRNPLAPVFARVMDLGQSVAPRHWLTLVVLVVAAVGFYQLLLLPQFTVTAANVRVRGSERAPVDQIYAASGLEGTNVFRVLADNTADRVAEVPGLDSVKVHVRLPADVIIDVVELSPIAVVQTITETIWIGSDGAGIRQVGEPPKLTLVDDSGTVRDARGTVLPEIVEGLETIQSNRPDLTDIHYGTLEGLYFSAPEGYTVYLGQGGAMIQKLALLEATQRQVAEWGMYPDVMDLRYDGYAMLR
jgi:cell division septal protein FtsQ